MVEGWTANRPKPHLRSQDLLAALRQAKRDPRWFLHRLVLILHPPRVEEVGGDRIVRRRSLDEDVMPLLWGLRVRRVDIEGTDFHVKRWSIVLPPVEGLEMLRVVPGGLPAAVALPPHSNMARTFRALDFIPIGAPFRAADLPHLLTAVKVAFDNVNELTETRLRELLPGSLTRLQLAFTGSTPESRPTLQEVILRTVCARVAALRQPGDVLANLEFVAFSVSRTTYRDDDVPTLAWWTDGSLAGVVVSANPPLRWILNVDEIDRSQDPARRRAVRLGYDMGQWMPLSDTPWATVGTPEHTVPPAMQLADVLALCDDWDSILRRGHGRDPSPA